MAGTAGLAILLFLACQTGAVVIPAPGMSAPSAPARVIEAAGAAQQHLPSQSDWAGVVPQRPSLSFSLPLFGVREDAEHNAPADLPFYGPLHRRPPPSFS